MPLPTAIRMLVVFALCASAQAGSYSGPSDGLGQAEPVFEGWISQVLHINHPQAGSGGFSRDESGGLSNVPPLAALAGRPTHFGSTGAVSHVVSLGNGGSITVGFDAPITNGDGPDFAVFENGFIDETEPYMFAELAFVEVGTSTSHWARFDTAYEGVDVVYALNNIAQDWYASQDVTLIDGFAGKHVISEGSPFDLDSLTNHPAVLSGEVDLGNIRYVRLTDVIGDGSTRASDNHPIYDPYYDYVTGYPAAAATAGTDGFDLRAIGVIHHQVHLEIDANELQWMGHSNATYQLQQRPSGTWTNLGPARAGANAMMHHTHSNGVFNMYRVVKTK